MCKSIYNILKIQRFYKKNLKIITHNLWKCFPTFLMILFHSRYFFVFSETMPQKSVVRLDFIYKFAVLLEDSRHIESVFAVLVRKCGSFQS